MRHYFTTKAAANRASSRWFKLGHTVSMGREPLTYRLSGYNYWVEMVAEPVTY